MKDVAFQGLTKYIKDCASIKCKISAKRTCILQLLNIEQEITNISGMNYLLQCLPKGVKKLTKGLVKLLKKKSKHESKKKRATEEVKSFLDDINTILLEKDPKSVSLAEEVANLKIVLQRFLLGKEL